MEPVLTDLVEDERYWSQRIEEAIARLVGHGVSIHVIFSQHDGWCLYEHRERADQAASLLKEWPLSVEKREGANDRHFHEDLGKLRETLDKVCDAIGEILAKSVATQKVP